MSDDAMADEFDVVAAWTADVALDLGTAYRIPAGCRGSGSPAGLLWLAEHLDLRAGEALLDVGAGVGGPAAFVAQARDVRPVLGEPAAGVCRAARRLFDHPVVRCSATALPWRDGSFDVAWSLGVLCTIPRDQQPTAVRELARVLPPGGRLGLLAFVAATDPLPFQPQGNAFPTRERLDALLAEAGFTVAGQTTADELAWESEEFDRRAGQVESELARRHGDDDRWRTAQHQSELIGRLIGAGDVVPTYLAAVRS